MAKFDIKESKTYISRVGWEIATSLHRCTYLEKSNNITNEEEHILQLFDDIRKSHFRFREELEPAKIKIAAHGCLELSKITLQDFQSFQLQYFDEIIAQIIMEDFIEKHIPQVAFDNIIRDAKKIISDSIHKPKYCFYLKKYNDDIDHDRQAFFRDFSSMRSLLFFYNNNDPNEFVFLKFISD